MLTTALFLMPNQIDHPVVDYAKLLGVIVSNDLKWEKNTNHIIKNANKMMKMLILLQSLLETRYISRISTKHL